MREQETSVQLKRFTSLYVEGKCFDLIYYTAENINYLREFSRQLLLLHEAFDDTEHITKRHSHKSKHPGEHFRISFDEVSSFFPGSHYGSGRLLKRKIFPSSVVAIWLYHRSVFCTVVVLTALDGRKFYEEAIYSEATERRNFLLAYYGIYELPRK